MFRPSNIDFFRLDTSSITFFLFGVSYVLYDLFINIFRAISLFSNSEAVNQDDEEKLLEVDLNYRSQVTR